MVDSQDKKSYLDIGELVAHTGLSEATIWRLKRAGRIPFFQPAGKGGRVKFPEDAIESAGLTAVRSAPRVVDDPHPSERLPGPLPKWMSPDKQNKSEQ